MSFFYISDQKVRISSIKDDIITIAFPSNVVTVLNTLVGFSQAEIHKTFPFIKIGSQGRLLFNNEVCCRKHVAHIEYISNREKLYTVEIDLKILGFDTEVNKDTAHNLSLSLTWDC